MFRKTMVFVLLMFLSMLMVSCEQEEIVPLESSGLPKVTESFDDYFRIVLYSEKDVYNEAEEVKIWGTLEYIGKKDSIEIKSGSPYIGYTVESDGIEYISFMRLTLLMTTTLEKGEIYEFPLIKSGGFSEDAEDADFWRDFYNEEKMLFPTGVYQLTFSTSFTIDAVSDYHLSSQYEFEVE